MNHSQALINTVASAQRTEQQHTPNTMPPPALNCHWLHETSGNRLTGVLGRTILPRRGADDPLLLLLLGLPEGSGPGLAPGLATYGGWQSLPGTLRRRLGKIFHPVRSEHDWTLLVESFGRLTAFRDRILEAAPRAVRKRRRSAPADAMPATTAVELELPLLDRSHWSRRAGVLPTCTVEPDHTGRILVRPTDVPRRDHYLMQQTTLAVAAGLLEHEGDTSLTFRDERIVPSESIPLTLAPLVDRYGAIPPAIPREWKQVRIAIAVEASLARSSAWFACPKENSLDRYAAFAAISRHVQRSLRRWMPYLHYADLGFFSDRHAAGAMLVYQAGKTYYRKGRPECTYDPMSRASVGLACRYARLRLPAVLGTVSRQLETAGLDEIAQHYRPPHAARILAGVRCGNRRFLTLLDLDRQIMERFHRLGNYCRTLQNERSAVRTRLVLRGVHQVNRIFQRRLRRLSSLEDVSWLGTLTTVEATAVLATHLGVPTPIELTVHLSDAGGQPGRPPIIVRSSLLP